MCPRRSSGKDEVQRAIIQLIVVPIIALLSIYFAGVLIETMFGVPDTIKKLFWSVGDIAFLTWYFRIEISSILRR